MAGHSKWKNIRIRKGKQDALRAKIFTKLSREIIVAARMGGGDPTGNPRLRVALEKAKDISLPSENIKRAIQRGTGEVAGADYEETTYEGYGPAGSALIVECYTENKVRTVADIRHVFVKNGGNFSESGSVSWQFKHLGQINISNPHQDEESMTLQALDAGAEDIICDENGCQVYTSIENLHSTNEELLKQGYKTEEISLTWVATNKTELSSENKKKLIKLLDALEDLDDVKDTYVNVDLTEEDYNEA